MITSQESSRFSLIVLSHIIVKKKQTRLSLLITKTKTPKIINLRRPFTHSKHNTIISWIHCSLAKAHSHYTKQKLTGKRRQTRHRCCRGRGHHHHPRGCPPRCQPPPTGHRSTRPTSCDCGGARVDQRKYRIWEEAITDYDTNNFAFHCGFQMFVYVRPSTITKCMLRRFLIQSIFRNLP